MKKVSVIITSFNKGKFLNECINSVKNQSYQNLEIILIDDCSTDSYTIGILKELKNDNQINIFKLTENKGVSNVRNFGIKNSTGEYILIVDGDDKISDTYIEKAVKIIESDSEYKIVSCEVELFGYYHGKMPLAKPEIEYLIAQNALIISSLFRKSDFEKTSGFNENMKEGLEDWDFWLSILEKGGKVYRIPEVHFYYRISKKSRNNLDFEKLRRLRKQIYENHKELYSKYLLDPVNSFEYTLLKNSKEYRLGKFLLKPLRIIFDKFL